MSYDKDILNKIDRCFETQLDRIRDYKKKIHSVYEKIIEAFENNDVQIVNCYNNVYVSDDRLEFDVNVRVPIDKTTFSIIQLLFESNDRNVNSNTIYYSDIDKKNIIYGKNYLNDKFNEYFSKCNYRYSSFRIENEKALTIEIRFVRKENYSDIV